MSIQAELDLMGDSMSGANLRGKILRGADLSNRDLSGAELSGASLRGANLRGADFTGAVMRGVDMRFAELNDAILTGANLSAADMRWADLRGANLSTVDASFADMSYADLRGANMDYTDLRGANLSGANVLSQARWMRSEFERDAHGFIVYKAFGNTMYSGRRAWILEPGAFLEEAVNPCRTVTCGCGVNFGTIKHVRDNYAGCTVWKCRIRFEDAAGIVVPYNTNGAARCERLELLEEVS